MYVDDWITGQDTQEESLLISLHAENIMKEAGMEMRKWISNDTTLMSQWAAKGFDTYPVDTSVSLGSNKTKVLGLAWQTLDDCLTLDTKGLLEFISTNKNTKRFMLQAIGKIFDPLGLISPFTIRMKCLIQELYKNKITWDKDLPPKIVERGLSADSLLSDEKWWNGPSFLQFDELSGTDSECPELNEEEYLPELKLKDSKEIVVLTLNLNQTIYDYLLTYSNRFLTIVRVLSFLFRFIFNCKDPGNKKEGPLTSEEMTEAEFFLIKQEQLMSFHTEMTAM
ncbi:integrase catalytic domain-containing protein [Nephila pilipes]|uniref:Integrase catalytic domain-containing protein n=1 Tax=Nephila pilipes TaxID=299642 RepID=A0A8X6NL34_NEPPI|nr:integrase catalytic domain-containing protein [Nephila pilipes]